MIDSLTNDLLMPMIRIRMVEERISVEYAKQKMRCPVHLSIGQEGTAVGVCAPLDANDDVVSAHRSHAHYLAKGGNLREMIAELYGKQTGCAGGRGGSMHLIDPSVGMLAAVPIVGSAIPIAVGAAWAKKLKGDHSITAVFFGDGATEEGVFAESLDFAALHDLNILFICEHNRYSVYTELKERQSASRSIVRIAEAHGVAGKVIDGNDAISLYDSVSSYRLSCVRGKAFVGPFLIECPTYRWLEHCGPNCDDHLGYRPYGELKTWKNKCPIQVICKKHKLSQSELDHLTSNIQQEIDNVFDLVMEDDFPSLESLFNHVYDEV